MFRHRSAAQAVLCALVLLLQATLLPLAHARHAVQRSEYAAAPRLASEAAPMQLRDLAPLPDGHDAAACPLCATIAHGRVGLKPLSIAIALVERPLWAVHGDGAAPVDRPAHAAGGPRAPPLFSA